MMRFWIYRAVVMSAVGAMLLIGPKPLTGAICFVLLGGLLLELTFALNDRRSA